MNSDKLIGAGLLLGVLALVFSQRASATSTAISPAPYIPRWNEPPTYQPNPDPFATQAEPDFADPYYTYYDETNNYTTPEFAIMEPETEPSVSLDLDAMRQENEPGAFASAIALAFQPSSSSTFDPMQNANVIAFLDMIAYAEGAGYSTLFGGDTFVGFDDHPRKVIRKSGYVSSAAGRYQFLRKTWDDVAPKIGATSFDPYWQDRAAVYLIKRKGALADVIAGRFADAVNKVRKIWASLPGAGYGQPERNYDKLLSVYIEAGGTVLTV